MNFLKKKLKPLTAGLTSNAHQTSNQQQKDLEDDLYDDYVVEAPPHPSELIALGVDPSEIDVNDPDKLRELYRKAKERGKDKQVNSVLLAKQREKEEIEEKKRTREEWKFFDSLTSRVEQAVKESQKNLDHWRESSAVDKLTEPEYELHLSAEQEIKLKNSALQEKAAQLSRQVELKKIEETTKKIQEQLKGESEPKSVEVAEELDEFGCPKRVLKADPVAAVTHNPVVVELLEDFGIDLRSEEQKRAEEARRREEERKRKEGESKPAAEKRLEIKPVARPRPRAAGQAQENEEDVDPFDTSFIAPNQDQDLIADAVGGAESETSKPPVADEDIDPFDTSYIDI